MSPPSTRLVLPALLALAALWPLAAASDAVPTEKDPVTAKRAVKLAEKLRCLVCQNQTIADSNAELAQDLRGQIREQIAAGQTDDQIVTYMVNRYGDFVLYQPPFKATTILLWTGPALLFVAGFFVLLRHLRRQPVAEPSLTAEERERASRLLEDDPHTPQGGAVRGLGRPGAADDDPHTPQGGAIRGLGPPGAAYADNETGDK